MSPKNTSLVEEEGTDVGWTGKRCRILLSQPRLRLTTFYDSDVYGTHESEGVGHGRRDGKVA